MNKVSVIIPVYNVEKYLRECLDSVLRQTLKELEILCVNDASTDGSLSILKEYEALDSRIRVIDQPENKGQATARNTGLRESNGEYIYFLDSDDKLADREALEMLCRKAAQNQADVVIFDSRVIYESEDLRRQNGDMQYISDLLSEGIYSGRDYFCWQMEHHIYACAVWRQLWKRSYLHEKGLCFQEDTSPVEDSLFSFRAILPVETLVYFPKPLHTYRIRGNSSMTMSFTKKHFLAYCRCFFSSLRFIEKRKPNEREMKALYWYLMYGRTHINDHLVSVIQNGEDLNQAVMETGWDGLYLKMLLLADYPRLSRLFTPDEYQRMKRAEKVVVYGNGRTGQDVRLLLCRFGIEGYEVAVTKKKPDVPANIHEIAEFAPYGQDCLVIVAVTHKSRRELESNLNSLGLTQYIYLGD